MTSATAKLEEVPINATARAALYLRVSTGRQADSDLSIPDQRRQIEAFAYPAAGRSRPSLSSRATPRPMTVAPPSRR